MKQTQILVSLMIVGSLAYSREYHVSKNGNDIGTGTEMSPFLTINRAAQAEVFLNNKSLYERVNPIENKIK
jgi:hypothetical protein